MKILDWVHRKFRQNSTQGVKDAVSSDGHMVSLHMRSDSNENDAWRPRSRRKMANSDGPKGGADEAEAAWSAIRSDDVTLLFSNFQRGLLAIGTFGLEQAEGGPEIESLGMRNLVVGDSCEDVTPSEVELFHEELEKVFGTNNADDAADHSRAKDDEKLSLSDSDSSKENTNANYYYFCGGSADSQLPRNQNVLYPLHEFFHSPLIESPASRKESTRTSLGDLFSSTKQLHESDSNSRTSEKPDNVDNKKRNTAEIREKSIARFSFVKKILRRKPNSALADGHGVPAAERKLDKLMGMFHKKIHPDADHHSAAAATASGRFDYREHRQHVLRHGNNGEDSTFVSVTDQCQQVVPQENQNKTSCHSEDSAKGETDHSQISLPSIASQALAQGHWIKTDADYVVLEL